MDDPAARPRPRAIVLSDRHPHWSEGKPAGNVGPQWAVLLALLLGEARAAPWLRDLPGDAGDLPRAPANVAGHREAIRGLEKRGAVSRTGGALSLTCSSDVVEALSTPEPDPLALARLFEAIDWILRKLDLDPAREEEAGLASIRMALVGYLARWQVALGHKAGPRPIDFPNGSKLKRLSLRRPWLERRLELWLRTAVAPPLVLEDPLGAGGGEALEFLRAWPGVRHVETVEALSTVAEGAIAVTVDARDRPELLAWLTEHPPPWPSRVAAATASLARPIEAEVVDLASPVALDDLVVAVAERLGEPHDESSRQVPLRHARFLLERCEWRTDRVAAELGKEAAALRRAQAALAANGEQARVLRVLAATEAGRLRRDELLDAADAAPNALDALPLRHGPHDVVELNPRVRSSVPRRQAAEGHAHLAREIEARLLRREGLGDGSLFRDAIKHLVRGRKAIEIAPRLLAELVRPDRVAAWWRAQPELFAAEFGHLLEGLSPELRSTRITDHDPAGIPATFAELRALVHAAAERHPVAADLWTALHDSALNRGEPRPLVAALRERAVEQADRVVCLLAEPDPLHPHAQLWGYADRGTPAPLDVVRLGDEALLLVFGSRRQAELLRPVTGERRTVQGLRGRVACAAPIGGDAVCAATPASELACLGSDGRIATRVDVRELLGVAGSVIALAAVGARRCAAVSRHESGDAVVVLGWRDGDPTAESCSPVEAGLLQDVTSWPRGEAPALAWGRTAVVSATGRRLLGPEDLDEDERVIQVQAHGTVAIALTNQRLISLHDRRTVASSEDVAIHCAAVLADGSILTGSEHGEIHRRSGDSVVGEPVLEAHLSSLTPYRAGEVVAVDSNGAIALLDVRDGRLHVARRDRLPHEPTVVRGLVGVTSAELATSAGETLDLRAWDVDRLEERRRPRLSRLRDLALVAQPGGGTPLLVVLLPDRLEVVRARSGELVGGWDLENDRAVLKRVTAIGAGRIAVSVSEPALLAFDVGPGGLSEPERLSDAHGRVVAIAANAGGAALVATRPAPDEVELRRLGDGGVVHVLRRRHDPALAVSGHGLRAWNDGGDVVIDDGVAGPQPVPLEYQCTNLVWAGERVVAAAYNGLITVVEAVDGEWQPRRLPTRRRRVDELVGVGPAAVLLRRGREVALCPLDDPVREVILPEHADALAAVAMGDGRDVWWLTVAGEHPEALTWREVRSRS